METTFIYCLREPDTRAIRYVGKSDNPKKRLSAHLGEARDRNCHRKVWLYSLATRGLRPVLEVIDEVPRAEWQAWECAYIEFFREEGHDLTNNTNGGDGVVNLSPEARERGRLKQAGRKQPLEHVEKRKLAMPRGEKHHFHGCQMPETTKKKITGTKVGVKAPRNTSGFVGVSRDAINNMWSPHLCIATKRIYLGRFAKLEDAVFVRALAVEKYFSKSP